MIQVLQENKRPSLGQRLSEGVGRGLEMGSQIMQQRQMQEQAMQQQQMMAEAGQQLLGMDISAFDPDTQKALLVEGLKQHGRGARQMQSQSYLDQLFGGNQQQPQTEQDQIQPQSIEQVTGREVPQGFDASKLTDEDIARATSIDPNLGRALGHAKDVSLRESREKNKSERKETLEFHKESQKYDEDLSEKTRRAKSQIQTFGDIEKAINSGNVKPSSWTNIFRNFGEVGHRMSNAIMNKDEATLLSSIPQLLEGWKQVFGVRLTDADLRVLQDKLPDIGKSADANRAILKIMKKYGDMTLLRSKIASQIKKSNKGIRPLGYSDMIEERFDEMTKPVRVVNPKTGNTIEIPAYKLSDAIEAGAALANE